MQYISHLVVCNIQFLNRLAHSCCVTRHPCMFDLELPPYDVHSSSPSFVSLFMQQWRHNTWVTHLQFDFGFWKLETFGKGNWCGYCSNCSLNDTPLNDTLRFNTRVYREDLTEWRFVRSRFTLSIVLKMMENVGLTAVCQSFNQHVLRTLTPRKITLFCCGSFIFITNLHASWGV